jgi:hypothetical protein
MLIVVVVAAGLGVARNAPAQPPPRQVLNQAESRALLVAAARLYGLDPSLLAAIATVESGGNPDAVSSKGAQGLMQLMPQTARRFDVENPFDPVDNVLGAVRFLDFLRRWQSTQPELHGDLAELLAAYNAGEGAVAKYHGVPPYRETQEYVRRVMIAYLLNGPYPSESPVPQIDGAATANRFAFPPPAIRQETGRNPLDQMAQIRRDRSVEVKRMMAQGWIRPDEH